MMLWIQPLITWEFRASDQTIPNGGKSKDVYCYLLFYPDKEVNYPTLQKITLSFVNLRIIQ